MQATPKKRRWLDNMIKAAKTETTAMPWERGQKRAALIANRTPKAKAA